MLGLLIILVLWSLLSSDDEPEKELMTPLSSHVNPASDYGMTNFTMTIMDENGIPARVIDGEEMTHYPDDDRTEIIMPKAHFIENEQDTWLITSQHGKTHGKGEQILLTGDVVITRVDNDDIKLETEELTLNTENNTAYTNEAVKIASPYGATNSVGLHATLKDETINLHSKVKGQYDAPPTQ